MGINNHIKRSVLFKAVVFLLSLSMITGSVWADGFGASLARGNASKLLPPSSFGPLGEGDGPGENGLNAMSGDFREKVILSTLITLTRELLSVSGHTISAEGLRAHLKEKFSGDKDGARFIDFAGIDKKGTGYFVPFTPRGNATKLLMFDVSQSPEAADRRERRNNFVCRVILAGEGEKSVKAARRIPEGSMYYALIDIERMRETNFTADDLLKVRAVRSRGGEFARSTVRSELFMLCKAGILQIANDTRPLVYRLCPEYALADEAKRREIKALLAPLKAKPSRDEMSILSAKVKDALGITSETIWQNAVTEAQAAATVGERIRILRLAKEKSKEKLAEEIGRSVQSVIQIEKGRAVPGAGTIKNIADALEVKEDVFDPANTPKAAAARDNAKLKAQNASTPGERVRILREGRGWTRRMLAKKSGVYIDTITAIETGDTVRMKDDTAARLATALGVEPEFITEKLESEKENIREEIALKLGRTGDIGDRLRAFREGLGMTRPDLADSSGVPVDTIISIENHTSRNPRQKTIRLLAEALGISPSLILLTEKLFEVQRWKNAVAKAAKAKTTGERVRIFREGQGMSQRALSKEASVAENTVLRIEGGRQEPGDRVLEAIAVTLGVDKKALIVDDPAGKAQKWQEALDEAASIPGFGARFNRLREGKGWTQGELGKRAKVDPATLSHLKNTDRKPEEKTVQKIASALGVAPEVLTAPATDGTPALRIPAGSMYYALIDIENMGAVDLTVDDLLKVRAKKENGKDLARDTVRGELSMLAKAGILRVVNDVNPILYRLCGEYLEADDAKRDKIKNLLAPLKAKPSGEELSKLSKKVRTELGITSKTIRANALGVEASLFETGFALVNEKSASEKKSIIEKTARELGRQGDAGSRLRAFREALGMTRVELAGKTMALGGKGKRKGVPAATIANIEKHRVQRPRKETIELLARALGISSALILLPDELNVVSKWETARREAANAGTLGKKIRMLRKGQRLSQIDLARAADMSESFIGYVENDQSDPSYARIEALAAALGVDVEELIVKDSEGDVERWEEALREAPSIAGFGARVDRLRKGRGLTQVELGTMSGIEPAMLRALKADGRKPLERTVTNLASALGVEPGMLTALTPEEEKAARAKALGQAAVETDPGKRLKIWREALGLTRPELSAISGVGKKYIYDIERGAARNPSPKVLSKLAAALGVPEMTFAREAAAAVKNNEARNLIDELSVRAAEASRSNRKIVIGIDDAILLNKEDVQGLLSAVKTLAEKFGVVLVRGKGGALAGEVIKAAGGKDKDLGGVIVLSRPETLEDRAFDEIRSTQVEARACLIGVDTVNIKAVQDNGKEALYQILDILTAAMRVALSGRDGAIPVPDGISIQKTGPRQWLFIPRAQAVDIGGSKATYDLQKKAIDSAA